MAFRATNQIQADGLAEAKRLANHASEFAVARRDLMAAAAVSGDIVIQVQAQFQTVITRWNAIKTIPGIAQYAKDQENDPTYDIVTEFNAMIAAAEVVRDRVETDIPTDGSGFLLLRKFQTNAITMRTFTTAQTAQLRTDLDSFIATVS